MKQKILINQIMDIIEMKNIGANANVEIVAEPAPVIDIEWAEKNLHKNSFGVM